MKRIALLLSIFLAGCSDGITGAYQASVQYGQEDPRPVGIAIIQTDRILADGRSAPVAEWKRDGDTFTAFDPDGKRLIQLVRNNKGDLVQTLPMSRVVYHKFEF